MAGGRPATPSSSRATATTRSAIKKKQQLVDSDGVEVEGGVLTPTRKKQQQRAEIASKSTGSSNRRLKNNSDVILHPPLPRPPSWQQGIATTFDKTLISPRRRQRRTSNDERDPGDSVNSTEDEMELDEDNLPSTSTSMMLATPAGKVNNKILFKGESMTPLTSSKNNIDDEKHNICVCVRIRPSATGAAEHDTPIWNIDSNTGKISLSENHPIIEKRKTVTDDAYDFKFDSLLVPPDPTSTMYEGHIRPVVSAAMEGYNGTIFSYGQTGSGKTHTMTGSDEEPGVLPLAISDIFQQISTDTERGYLLRVSYLEIYNETLKDLLEPVKQKNQELRVGEDKHGRIIVHNMKEEVVTSPQAVLEVLTRGEDNRSVNCTDWNQRSSRSHCVFSMTIESRPRKDTTEEDDVEESIRTPSPTEAASQPDKSKQARGKIPVRISQLNLIDLAGSERATSQEERRKEGAFINKSLLSLGNVIQKLAEGKNGTSHIPYRDSKLTRLLQTSLSGNARIAIICTISPEARHGIESVSTLKFAQRASKIVTKAEQGIIYGPGALIAEYEETIANLQSQLADARKNNTQSHPVVRVEALEEERRRREQAEKEAKDYSMSVISLQSQIDHLKALMLTGSAGTGDSGSSIPRTPSMAKRNYGEIGSGTRPNGPPGSHRRLSEMAFGIGSPLRNTGLPASSSMRSISSALEAMPNTENDSKVRKLEEELASMRLALEKEQSTSRKKIEDLEEEGKAYKTRQVEAEAETERLRQLNQHLEDERHITSKNLTTLEEQLATSRSKEERVANDHIKQTKQTEDLTSQLQDLRRLLSQREKRISELEENAATSGLSASAATTKLQQDVEKLRRALDDTAAAHAKESAASAETILQVQKDLADRQARFENKEKELETLQEALSEAIEQVQSAKADGQEARDDHKAIVEKLEAQIATLKREQAQEVAEIDAEYRQNMKQLQKSLKGTEKDLAKCTKILAEKEATLSSLKDDLATRNQELGVLKLQDTANRKTIEDLEGVVKEKEETVSALTTACADKDRRVISLKEELDKKEQARIRLASLKAANTPPDFGALQAKMQAVSSRSASKSLSNSLGSLDKSKNDAPSEVERALADTRAELQATQRSLREAEKTIASSDQRVQELLRAEKEYIKRIAELESAIAGFRKQIEANRQKLEELQLAGGDDLAKELRGLSLQAASPERKAPPPPLKVAMPLGAMSPHRAATSSNNASYRPSGLSTPTKKDSHGYAWNSRPDPLPLPPGTPEWRKQRRQTTEHELERLRTGGLASRNKTILQSPRLERPTMDWSSHERSGSPSNQNSPMRIKKGSGGSNYSVY